MRIFGHVSMSTRRIPLALLAVIALTIAVVVPANAVHDLGVFQLDRNAQSSVQSAIPATDDWDKVCPSGTPSGGVPGVQCIGGISAQATTFDTDGVNASIFTGGGSKDDLNTTSWQWKDGSVPPKDDLAHAYAVRYASGLLYFGADRTANNGDSQIGFWFFRGNVGPRPGGTFGPDSHQNGDILILSDFTQGGTTVTIRVFAWHSPGGTINGTLDLLAGTTTNLADCVGPPPVSSGDPFCATVNKVNTPSPWAFTDKGGAPNGYFAPGEFYEGGVDLAFLGLADECFSSFLAETRSSQSVDATLKDFVGGGFGVCSATMSTTPSAGAGGTVAPGTIVTDTATVTGTSPTKTPTGSVTFYLCGPIATGTCTTGGTLVGSATLSGSGGTATATSSGVDTSGFAAGRYCFRATWPGDTNYPGALSHSGTGDSECFYVARLNPTLTTQASAPITVGSGSLSDTATLSGATATATGTITFSLYDNATCTGTAIFTSTSTLVSGVTVYTSGSYTPTTAGTYYWIANYSGDANNTATANGCGLPNESVVVSPRNPTLTTQASAAITVGSGSLSDTATLSGATATATGTITFSLYDNATCTGTAIFTSTSTLVSGVTVYTSGSYTPTAVGTYYWIANYSGDANNTATANLCGAANESVIVTDTSSTVTKQNWLPNDSATLTTGGGTSLNGTLSFTLFESNNCTGTVLRPAETFTLTNAASGSIFNTTNSTVLVLTSTTVSWGVIFTSSDPLVGSSSRCETTTLTVDNR